MNRVWTIDVIAGNFNRGRGSMLLENTHLSMNSPTRWLINEKIKLDHIVLARPLESHETGAGLAATLGLGAAGYVLLGPLGVIGGILLGNRRQQEVLGVIKLLDGRTIVANMPAAAMNYLRGMLGAI